MNISYNQLVECFKRMKDSGIPIEEASDALELDSDQDVEFGDIDQAIIEAYKETI